MTEKQIGEIETIVVNIAHSAKYGKHDFDFEYYVKELKTLFKKCVWYKAKEIGIFDNEGILIKKYRKPEEVIIKDSQVIKEIKQNIDKL